MEKLYDRDYACFKRDPDPVAIVQEGITAVSGTLTVDEGSGEVRFLGGLTWGSLRDTYQFSDCYFILERVGRERRLCRLASIERSTEVQGEETYLVVGHFPFRNRDPAALSELADA